MNIAMTGATGYIGKHLSNYLTEKDGHRIILTWLLRNKSPNILSSVKWRKPTTRGQQSLFLKQYRSNPRLEPLYGALI